MTKLEMLIKELQLHVDREELNEVIDEKMWAAWRAAKNESTEYWLEKEKKYKKNLLAHLTLEDKKKMYDTHFFIDCGSEFDEEVCTRCEIDYNDFYDLPQFCVKKNDSNNLNS